MLLDLTDHVPDYDDTATRALVSGLRTAALVTLHNDDDEHLTYALARVSDVYDDINDVPPCDDCDDLLMPSDVAIMYADPSAPTYVAHARHAFITVPSN